MTISDFRRHHAMNCSSIVGRLGSIVLAVLLLAGQAGRSEAGEIRTEVLDYERALLFERDRTKLLETVLSLSGETT